MAPGTLKGRHYAQIFLILLLFMFAIFTRKSIWIYYVRLCVARFEADMRVVGRSMRRAGCGYADPTQPPPTHKPNA